MAGLNRREWETEWELLKPLVVDSPAEALGELDDLLRRMLLARGYPLADGETEQTAEADLEPEVLAGYRVAAEITSQVEKDALRSSAEVAQAVGLYRELYEHLLTRAK